MGFFDFLRPRSKGLAQPQAMAQPEFFGFEDPQFLEWMRGQGPQLVAMRNTTVLRCVSLLSFSVGMLPLHLRVRETKQTARDHPLFSVLHDQPNGWQTAFEFRSYMQQCALGAVGAGKHGDAFARIARSRGRVISLIPLHPDRVDVDQRSDMSLEYRITRKSGEPQVLSQEEVFHLRFGLSEDTIHGLSTVRQAGEAIALSHKAQVAANRLFDNGVMAGGTFTHPTSLSPEAFERLKASLDAKRGPENAGKELLLEEGMKYEVAAANGKDAQGVEQRQHQIEEIARPFGVPRPLLGVDDTSWGSGIDVLGQMFVRYGLNPWFTAWEQAIQRSLLSAEERNQYEAKFNPGGLLRGSMKDQAEFFAKGLGAGGHQPWLHPDEPREWLDMPKRDDLPGPPGQNDGVSNVEE